MAGNTRGKEIKEMKAQQMKDQLTALLHLIKIESTKRYEWTDDHWKHTYAMSMWWKLEKNQY